MITSTPSRCVPFRGNRLLAGLVMAAALASTRGATLTLSEPLDHQVTQRSTAARGTVRVRGALAEADPATVRLELRVTVDGRPGEWQPLRASFSASNFTASVELPAGGWHQLEVRALQQDTVLATTRVDHVGVDEIFVVAGQSNSANHGAEKQTPKSALVVTFDGRRWRPAADPQPGASGGGGSFLPPFGDRIAAQFKVPVGFIACGIGATSVREWLPKGVRFPHPPTIEGRVRRLPDGSWESKGEAYEMLVRRMKALGSRGFRAVLWHQGESDANQRDTSRTLPGTLYREMLGQVIRDSRRDIGWDAPWFVAQVSYHVPGDESSPDIRAAQAALWADGIALPGPDSDALRSEFREDGGRGMRPTGHERLLWCAQNGRAPVSAPGVDTGAAEATGPGTASGRSRARRRTAARSWP